VRDQAELIEKLADHPVVTGADFDYPEHDPQWILAGSARVCGVCGMVDLPELQRAGTVLPTGVVLRGGPRISDEAEEFYRQEQWS